MKKHINQLQKLQNRAGIIVFKINLKSHFSVMSMHEILQWETLKSRHKFHIRVMIFKILNNFKHPLNYTRIYYIPPKPTNFGTVASAFLNRGQTFCKRAFFYRGAKLYNSLPHAVRDCTSLIDFKRSLF